MKNNTATIPWLVYRGIRPDGQDEEELEEHGRAEEGGGQEFRDAAETEDDDYGAVTHTTIRLRHIIRVRVDESLTAIPANAFAYCTELREIKIPETVTSIGNHAFFRCDLLVTIQIPCHLRIVEWNAFSFCCCLASIWLPDSVVSIGANAFQSCTALEFIRLPGSITSIESSAFDVCSTLATLEIPGSVISIGRLAFARCKSLQALRIRAPSSLSSIGTAAFARCPMLTEIDVGMMAVALWPRLFIQLSSRTGLFGHDTGIDSKQRTTFVLSFMKRHVTLLFQGGSTLEGWSRKRGR
jgi:hypothetical protein